MIPEFEPMLKSELLFPAKLYERVSEVSWSVADTCKTLVPMGTSSSSDALYGVPIKSGLSFSSETVTVRDEVACPPFPSRTITLKT